MPARTSRRRREFVPGSSTVALPSSVAIDEVIVLDSDEEGPALLKAKKRKRKGGHVDEGAKQVLDLSDSDEESDRREAVGKKARTQLSNPRPSNNNGVDSLSGPSGTSRNQRRRSDVIVIDD